MKKYANKQPVDALFARKLKDMSLPPGPDGFARLQARMGHPQPAVRAVFWRNPAVQQYAAIAACVLLCLLGWLYLSTETTTTDKTELAVQLPVHKGAAEQSNEQPGEQAVNTQLVPPSEMASQIKSNKTNVASSKAGKVASDKLITNGRELAHHNHNGRQSQRDAQSQPSVGAAVQTEQIIDESLKAAPAESISEKQVAIAPPKPASVAERVLVVTIAEPEALVAARQAVTAPPTDDKVIIATDNKPTPEAKTPGIWQQVKRLKQGEVFARKDATDDERGLIGRAYSGLKQTLDKDKSVKQ